MAAPASPAMPATVRSGSELMNWASPSRTIGWSSTSSRRCLAVTAGGGTAGVAWRWSWVLDLGWGVRRGGRVGVGPAGVGAADLGPAAGAGPPGQAGADRAGPVLHQPQAQPAAGRGGRRQAGRRCRRCSGPRPARRRAAAARCRWRRRGGRRWSAPPGRSGTGGRRPRGPRPGRRSRSRPCTGRRTWPGPSGPGSAGPPPGRPTPTRPGTGRGPARGSGRSCGRSGRRCGRPRPPRPGRRRPGGGGGSGSGSDRPVSSCPRPSCRSWPIRCCSVSVASRTSFSRRLTSVMSRRTWANPRRAAVRRRPGR